MVGQSPGLQISPQDTPALGSSAVAERIMPLHNLFRGPPYLPVPPFTCPFISGLGTHAGSKDPTPL